MSVIAAIFVGGGIGSVLRHLLSSRIGNHWGIMLVNVLGAMLIGMAYAYFADRVCVRKSGLLLLPVCWVVLRLFRLTCLILICCSAVGGFMRRCFICWVRWRSELHFWLSE